MNTEHQARLQAAILQAERDIAEGTTALERTAVELAGAPTDPVLLEAMARIDGVVASSRARLGHLMAARDAAAAADATGTRAERRAQRAATRTRIDKLTAEGLAAFQKIVEQAEGFGPVLARFARISEDLAGLARAHVTPVEQHLPLSRQHLRETVIDMTQRTPASALLRGALFDAGLGLTAGLQFDAGLLPYDGAMTLADHMAVLTRHLDDADKRMRERDRVLGDALEMEPEAPEPEPQQLVAMARGFHDGELIEPGQPVAIACDTPPAWAAPVGTPLPPKLGKTAGFDTKPVAARKAIEAKKLQFAAVARGDAPINRS